MKLKFLVSVLATLLAVGLLAACGGDDDDGDDGGTALSVEDYSAEVDGALASFNEEFGSLGDAARDPQSRGAYLDAVTAIQGRVTQTVEELNAIEPPDEAAEFHDDLVAAMGDLEQSFTPVIEATEAKDDQALLQAVGELQSATADFASDATELGAEAQEAGIEVPNLTGAPE